MVLNITAEKILSEGFFKVDGLNLEHSEQDETKFTPNQNKPLVEFLMFFSILPHFHFPPQNREKTAYCMWCGTAVVSCEMPRLGGGDGGGGCLNWSR